MGTIHLALSGNAFHSDTPEERWHVLDSERLGLEIIGESGLPVSVSFQGVDLEIFPWLKSVLAQHPSLEQIRAPYGHGLIPLLHPAQQRWEIENGPGMHRVMFFPEFYTPGDCLIPDMFFVLGPHTITHTAFDSTETLRVPLSVTGQDPESSAAIRYGEKIGLVMRGFNALLNGFFVFQRDPYSSQRFNSPLSQLLEEIERIANETTGTVIMPLDLEAPYIGSLEGAKIWETFLGALKRSGLDDIFVSLENVIRDLAHAERNVTARPHRELTSKWFGYEAQLVYYSFVRGFKPKNEREHFVLSLAGLSDALSSIYRKVTAFKESKALSFLAVDCAGREIKLRMGVSNNHVFDLCQSAWLALNENIPLVSVMKKRCNGQSLLIKRTLAWAETHGL
jgi:hypothetical protein